MDFKQTVIVSDHTYNVFIDKLRKEYDIFTDDNNIESKDASCNNEYKLSITEQESANEYTLNIKDINNCIEIIKSAFSNKYGITYNISFLSNRSQLKLTIKHPIFINECTYTLNKTTKEVSLNSLDERLSKLEKQNDTTLPKYGCFKIKRDMLGPCISITKDCDITKDEIAKYLFDIKKLNEQSHDIKSCISKTIKNFYKIKYLYQKEIPIYAKNQILINGYLSIYSSDKFDIIDIDNCYTILTNTLDDKEIGTVAYHGSGNIYIKLNNLVCDFTQKFKTDVKNNNNIECSEEEYLKYGYILKLPFDVEDGIYYKESNNNKSHFILIKNNFMYPYIGWMKNNIFSFSKNFGLNYSDISIRY